jgi:hypothetical protein
MKQEKTQQLLAAAEAVIKRWDTPNWKDVEPTAVFINELRKAVAQFDEKPANDC